MTTPALPTTAAPTGISSIVVVVTKTLPDEITFHVDEKPSQQQTTTQPKISDKESRLDALDDFNHPRIRRGYILLALLQQKQQQQQQQQKIGHTNEEDPVAIEFIRPSSALSSSDSTSLLSLYQQTHTEGLLKFFETAWQKWCDLGEDGRDPMASLNNNNNNNNNNKQNKADDAVVVSSIIPPAWIPGNVPLPREPRQRPSKNVMGQIGYYCTDICTPIFDELLLELQQDAAIMDKALEIVLSTVTPNNPRPPGAADVVYAIPTHPGHHAAKDSFGGYCYLNHAAMAAKQIQQRTTNTKRVAILDIDYHCGNGTASILQNNSLDENNNNNNNILVVSIHCHPDYDYPFHSGFATEEEDDDNSNNVFHIPLLPGATWKDQYEPALIKALDKIIFSFQAQALIISLGLDTLDGDPVTLRRAGFSLKPKDYKPMGILIGSKLSDAIPCLVIQEGGYKMDQLGQAAADVITGIAIGRRKSNK